MIRMKEKRRLQAGQAFAAEEWGDDVSGKVVSSWGPYTSIVGTAVKTSVAGLTAKAELTAMAGWEQMAPESKTELRSAVGDELVAAFNAMDTDGNGSISNAELREAMRRVNPEATDEQIANMVTLVDVSGDGEVTLQEFVMFMLFEQ